MDQKDYNVLPYEVTTRRHEVLSTNRIPTNFNSNNLIKIFSTFDSNPLNYLLVFIISITKETYSRVYRPGSSVKSCYSTNPLPTSIPVTTECGTSYHS